MAAGTIAVRATFTCQTAIIATPTFRKGSTASSRTMMGASMRVQVVRQTRVSPKPPDFGLKTPSFSSTVTAINGIDVIAGNHFVYMVECADGSLYTGYTTDIDRRMREHNDGTGAKYTRGRTPVELRYVEHFEKRGQALSREYEIKSLSTPNKWALIESRP